MKTFIHSFPRYLALAGLMVLAACQQTAPRRVATEPAVSRQAASTTQAGQQAPLPSGQKTPQAASGQTAPAITFYLAQTAPAQGLVQVKLDENTSVYAVPRPVFTDTDMQQVVSVTDKGGQAYVRFDFNQRSAERLALVTREALGNYLLVRVRDKFIGIQKISTVQQDGKLPVRVNSESDAKSILQSLR